jgi:hypothetical protein
VADPRDYLLCFCLPLTINLIAKLAVTSTPAQPSTRRHPEQLFEADLDSPEPDVLVPETVVKFLYTLTYDKTVK